MEIRVEYDDDADAIIAKVNDAIKTLGVEFQDDELVHDGFNVYKLEAVN